MYNALSKELTNNEEKTMKNLVKMIALAGALSISLTALAAEPVVDSAWVKAHSCDENVRVLDIRNPLDGGSKTDYLKGHIPLCRAYQLPERWLAVGG